MKRRKLIGNILKGMGATTLPIDWGRALADEVQPYILRIHCDGGWDQTMVFDDKISSTVIDTETAQSSGIGADGITFVSHGSRPSVDSFFAQHGSKSSIVNGLYCQSISRGRTIQTSFGKLVEDKTKYVQDYMDFYASKLGSKKVMPHLVFNAPYFPGESEGDSLLINDVTRNKFLSPPSNATEFDTDATKDLDDFLDDHYKTFVKSLKSKGIDRRKATVLDEHRKKESDFVTAFSNAVTTGADGSDSELVSDSKTALNLFQSGTSLTATVQAGRNLAWDGIADIYSLQSALFESLFSDLIDIVAYAESIGLGENLIILVTSESGRGPTLNANNGKNRWPYTSALAWGKYIRPGSVAGRTDEYLRGVPMNAIFGSEEGETDPITIENLFAALYFATNVNYASLLPGVDYLSLMIKLR